MLARWHSLTNVSWTTFFGQSLVSEHMDAESEQLHVVLAVDPRAASSSLRMAIWAKSARRAGRCVPRYLSMARLPPRHTYEAVGRFAAPRSVPALLSIGPLGWKRHQSSKINRTGPPGKCSDDSTGGPGQERTMRRPAGVNPWLSWVAGSSWRKPGGGVVLGLAAGLDEGLLHHLFGQSLATKHMTAPTEQLHVVIAVHRRAAS